jgi:hypothetical protein
MKIRYLPIGSVVWYKRSSDKEQMYVGILIAKQKYDFGKVFDPKTKRIYDVFIKRDMHSSDSSITFRNPWK